MNFKKVLYGILLLGFSSLSAGAETLYLHVFDNTGNWIVMNLDEVDRISYDAGTIKFSDEAGKELKAVDAASLTTMIVNESKNDVTGVENVSADNSGSGITLRGRLISADEDGSLAIYALDGGQIVEIDAYKAGQTVDVNALPSGVYVVVINGKSVKVAL